MSLNRASIFAGALRDELQMKGCADLQLVAEKFKLTIREVGLSGCDGALLRSSVDSSGIIAVNASLREFGRKRFTVAHEIGHRLLHGESVACTASDIGNWSRDTQNVEKESDGFAAELLLPSSEIGPLLNNSSPSIQKIEEIAKTYQASLSASAWQYCNVATVPCAIIWSTKEVVIWSRKSDSFRFFLRRGISVPQGSYAMAAYRAKELPTRPETAPSFGNSLSDCVHTTAS